MRAQTLFTALIAFPLLFACQTNAGKDTNTPPPLTTTNLEEVCSHEWLLRSLERDGKEIKLLLDGKITFQCTTDGKVAGTAGVNQYNGSFKLQGEQTIEWGSSSFAMTMMAGPDALMTQEKRYMDSLPKTQKLGMDGEHLVLSSDDNSVVLRFTDRSK